MNSRGLKTLLLVTLLAFVLIGCGSENEEEVTVEAIETLADTLQDREGEVGRIEVEEEIKIEEVYTPEPTIIHDIISAKDFSDGFTWVNVRLESGFKQWGAMNTEGEVQFFINDRPRTNFYNGVAMLYDYSIMDVTGNIVVDNNDTRFDRITRLGEGGHIWVEKQVDTLERSETLFGVLNNAGEWLHELEADYRLKAGALTTGGTTGYFGNGIYLVDYHHIADERGIGIYDFATMNRINFIEDVGWNITRYDEYSGTIIFQTAIVGDVSGIGYIYTISRDGTVERLPSFMRMNNNSINSGMVYIAMRNAWHEYYLERDATGFYDLQGNKLFDIPQLIGTPIFEGDYSFVVLANDGGVRFVTVIDREGNQLFEPIRANPINGQEYLSEGIVWIRGEDDNLFSIDVRGNILIDNLQADRVNQFKEGFSVIRINDYYHFIDREGNKLVIHYF
jgi:hypothetical protein